MGCCGKPNKKDGKPKVPNFRTKRPFGVKNKECVKCGGSCQTFPSRVQVGAEKLVKSQCTSCGAVYFRK